MNTSSALADALGPPAALREQVRYTGAVAERGFRLNQLISSLTDAARRQRFRDDPQVYLQASGLSATEIQMVLDKDCMAMFDYGVNIYAVAKAGTILGVPLTEIGAAMRARGARSLGHQPSSQVST